MSGTEAFFAGLLRGLTDRFQRRRDQRDEQREYYKKRLREDSEHERNVARENDAYERRWTKNEREYLRDRNRKAQEEQERRARELAYNEENRDIKKRHISEDRAEATGRLGKISPQMPKGDQELFYAKNLANINDFTLNHIPQMSEKDALEAAVKQYDAETRRLQAQNKGGRSGGKSSSSGGGSGGSNRNYFDENSQKDLFERIKKNEEELKALNRARMAARTAIIPDAAPDGEEYAKNRTSIEEVKQIDKRIAEINSENDALQGEIDKINNVYSRAFGQQPVEGNTGGSFYDFIKGIGRDFSNITQNIVETTQFVRDNAQMNGLYDRIFPSAPAIPGNASNVSVDEIRFSSEGGKKQPVGPYKQNSMDYYAKPKNLKEMYLNRIYNR